jgi:glycosyltransferase involved in cell wall biosynthesis
MRICAFAKLRDRAFFETHEFYRKDIGILRDLGYEVTLASSVRELLAARCDLYYGWWFGYGVFPALLGFLRRRPVVVSGVLHTLDCRGLGGWSPVKRALMKITMRLANCSILCSPGEFDRLDGFVPRHCEVVPLSIDSETYRWSDVKRDRMVLMITQLNRENVERKMVVPAIEAFAAFAASRPSFRFKICGAIGDGIDSVRGAIARFGLEDRVEIVGRVSPEEKVKLLQHAFAYLQPTSCEAFGLALGEALACGAPVVTSPESCVVATYGDAVLYGRTPVELAQALSDLAEDSVRYLRIQEHGLEHVRRYSYANRREAFGTIFDRLGR